MERWKKPLQLAGSERAVDNDASERLPTFADESIEFTQTRVVEVAQSTFERTRT
jgi:hypothetical protein